MAIGNLQKAVNVIEGDLVSHRRRVREQIGLTLEEENLQEVNLSLTRHRESDSYKNAQKVLDAEEVYLAKIKAAEIPEKDARYFLSYDRLNESSFALPLPVSFATSPSGWLVDKKPKFGRLLAVAERIGVPTAIAMLAYVGLDPVIHDSKIRWGVGGSAISLAGLSLGLQAVPDNYKLGPWQQRVQRRAGLTSDVNKILVNVAIEHMVNSYAMGINCFSGFASAVVLARENPAAIATTIAIFIGAIGIAGWGALPASKAYARPVSAALGTGASVVGACLVFVVHSAKGEMEEGSEGGISQGTYQATIGFPSAIGLLGAASFLRSFSAERQGLNETREALDGLLLEANIATLERSLATASENPSLQKEKSLVEAERLMTVLQKQENNLGVADRKLEKSVRRLRVLSQLVV